MQHNDAKNLMIAFALSMVILTLWQYFFILPQQEELRRQAEIERQQKAERQAIEQKIVQQAGENLSPGEVVLPKVPSLTREAVGRVRILSDQLHGDISLLGARFDNLTLANFHQTIDPESPEVQLLTTGKTAPRYFVEVGWLPVTKGFTMPGAESVWSVVGATQDIMPEQPVTLEWESPEGLRFTRTITLDDHYLFRVEQRVENTTSQAVQLVPYGRIHRARADRRGLYISHEGPIGVFDGVLEEISYDDMKDAGSVSFETQQGWLGMADKYWLTAFIPDQKRQIKTTFSYFMREDGPRYQVDYALAPITVEAGQVSEPQKMRLFAGAKKVALLDKYSEGLNVPLFDRAVDYGWLYFITKPMLYVLLVFYGWLENFGLAILMLTVCVKLLLFPLANKSYHSMARMREMQPELMAMRDKFKGDRQKMSEEMMKFYRDKKINPAAGCLPMIIQIPIFFALYKVLYVTIEMRHAPFYGWIKDLSAPDPLNVFTLFGMLDWTPPGWMPVIGVLPLAFAVTMFLQQRLNPSPTDPTQALVLRWLPVLFLFLFAGFAAGLVLYWTWSNMLSILQQWVITREVRAQRRAERRAKKRGKVKKAT